MTDDGRRMPSDGKSSHCLWQGELKIVFHLQFQKEYKYIATIYILQSTDGSQNVTGM